ncbi:MAG: hypothetical protein WBF47_10410, partial [Xanthobacteraceae bacterium]
MAAAIAPPTAITCNFFCLPQRPIKSHALCGHSHNPLCWRPESSQPFACTMKEKFIILWRGNADLLAIWRYGQE